LEEKMSGLDGISEADLDELGRLIDSRREECLAEGHKEVYWITEFLSYGDREVSGGCNYCLTPLTRNLNRDEWDAQKRFYDFLHEPMSI
jgi:hypothetical protein